jgi:hypothetical protein
LNAHRQRVFSLDVNQRIAESKSKLIRIKPHQALIIEIIARRTARGSLFKGKNAVSTLKIRHKLKTLF